MPLIRQLPPSVINKIAAGEVIERPASVVKELMENAVDSGATRIELTLQQGGLELVRVSDDGCGMEPEQLPLAVASHATSKIQDADDLFRVATLGFRGEALASIGEISHLRIRSRTRDVPAGAEVELRGGVLGEVAPCGCPVGTSIEVRNLFFNTPVRRKFQRSTQAELGHATEAFTRIALSYPNIQFTMRHQERLVYDLPATVRWQERIIGLFGEEIGGELIWVENKDETASLSGYVCSPHQSRSNNRMQYLILNGRYIRDRSLQHALGEAFRGLLLTGRFPIAFLRINLRPDTVDVNVHPTKLEVRFEDSGRVYSQLLGTLRTKFLSTDLTARVTSAAAPSGGSGEESSMQRDERAAAATPHGSDAFRLDAPGDVPRQLRMTLTPQPAWRPIPTFQPFPGSPNTLPQQVQAREDSQSLNRNGLPTGESVTRTSSAPDPSTVDPLVSGAFASAESAMPTSTRALQVQNRYIVTETEDGMVVIDQHALHERILYEQIRERVLGGNLESQRLLVPEPVSLTPAEAAIVLEAREVLSQLGLEVEPFGGDTVLVSAYPAMLSRVSPHEILRNVMELLMAGGKAPDRRDVLDELLHMMSCKAAIKAGDRLTGQEIDSLLEQRHLFQDTHHCPHGRPTSLVFTREELDRRFMRT